MLVSITNMMSGVPPMSLMPPRALSSLVFSRVMVEQFALGEAHAFLGKLLIEGAQMLDRIGNGLPVGERAAEPAGIHIILGRALGAFGDLLLGGALGADEQHAAALGHRVA